MINKNWGIITHRAYSKIRADLSDGILGVLWWVLEPILYLGAFYILIAVLGLRGGADAIPFLLRG